jgi:hypothetical protein
MRRSRIWPKPLGCNNPTAMTINVWCVRFLRLLRWSSGMGASLSLMGRQVSSTSATPLSRSRSGRTLARRKRCSIVQAVS